MAELERNEPRVVAVDEDVRAFLHERRVLGSPVALRMMGEELLAAADEVSELAAAGVRTCVVAGETDDAWPPQTQQEMATRLGAQFVTIPGAGHSPACETPDAFIDVLLTFWVGYRS